MVEIGRTLNPALATVVRTHSDDDEALLRKDGVEQVFMGEDALARGMLRYVLERFAADG